MQKLKKLFDSNQAWAEGCIAKDPDVFHRMAHQQKPKYLWIGCSDSRIPANEILGLGPGEMFVHRNIANQFIHTDFNVLSVLQFAVDYLNIEHVILCGHYGCGGIAAAMENQQKGLIDNWLCHIRDVYAQEKHILDKIQDPQKRAERLVELNVLHQVLNICHSTIVQNAWAANKPLSIHGWVYDVGTGLLKDLDCCISSLKQIDQVYHSIEQ